MSFVYNSDQQGDAGTDILMLYMIIAGGVFMIIIIIGILVNCKVLISEYYKSFCLEMSESMSNYDQKTAVEV
jgi:hypothetical protein